MDCNSSRRTQKSKWNVSIETVFIFFFAETVWLPSPIVGDPKYITERKTSCRCILFLRRHFAARVYTSPVPLNSVCLGIWEWVSPYPRILGLQSLNSRLTIQKLGSVYSCQVVLICWGTYNNCRRLHAGAHDLITFTSCDFSCFGLWVTLVRKNRLAKVQTARLSFSSTQSFEFSDLRSQNAWQEHKLLELLPTLSSIAVRSIWLVLRIEGASEIFFPIVREKGTWFIANIFCR